MSVGEGARALGQEEGKRLSRFPAASPAHPLAGAGSGRMAEACVTLLGGGTRRQENKERRR